MNARPTVMIVYGTRPEAIKVAPVIRALTNHPQLDLRSVVTGQHREMLDAVNQVFGIVPSLDLDVGRAHQSLTDIATGVLRGLAEAFSAARPDLVMVHGDTSTSTIAALAAYYHQVPVAHLEAGLRSGDLASPFPEEGNRRVTAQLAQLQLAPTYVARQNLIRENVSAESIVVTGNTVIDALLTTAGAETPFVDRMVARAASGEHRLIVATLHRRESWESGLRDVAVALRRVLDKRVDTVLVLPLHKNPIVRDAIVPVLGGHPRALLTEPMDYPEFCHLLKCAHLVVTDSGGVQEEAPSLGKPVLVTRETTERPEAVAAGTVRLVGTDAERVERELLALLDDHDAYAAMARATNPYGDGNATRRVVAAVSHLLGVGSREPDFCPGA